MKLLIVDDSIVSDPLSFIRMRGDASVMSDDSTEDVTSTWVRWSDPAVAWMSEHEREETLNLTKMISKNGSVCIPSTSELLSVKMADVSSIELTGSEMMSAVMSLDCIV